MNISVERALKYFLHGAVFLGCLIFTLYQSYNCFMKYHSFPKGTSIGFHSTNGVGENFPAISICSRYDNYMEKYLAFNETALSVAMHPISGKDLKPFILFDLNSDVIKGTNITQSGPIGLEQIAQILKSC